MGQHWAWINSAKKEWFNAYAFPSNGGDKYMEHFYSGKFMYPTIMMMMTDTSSYRSSSEDCEAVEDIVGRWSGDKVIFSSDDTKQKRLKLTDKYTCINYLVAPAVLKTLCSDLPKNEVIEFIGSPLENFTDYRYPPIGDGYSPDAAMMKAILKNKGITRIDATKSDDVSIAKVSLSRIACMVKEVESQLEGLQKKRKL